jgi:hypothetical protein
VFLETNSKNKNIRDLYRGIIYFKRDEKDAVPQHFDEVKELFASAIGCKWG